VVSFPTIVAVIPGGPLSRPPARRRAPRPAASPGPHAVIVLNSLRRVVRAFRAWAQAVEETLAISGAQHFVLEQLAHAPAASLNDLAARTHTHKSSVSVVVARLVERGFVRRTASPADRRLVALSLTAAGRRALSRVPFSAQSRLVAALERLPPRHLAAFATDFERFTRELGIHEMEPTLMFESAPRSDGRASPRRARARASTKRS